MQVTKYSSTGITLDLKTLLCTPSPEVSPGHEDVLQLHRSLRHKAGVLSGRYFKCNLSTVPVGVQVS